MRYFRHDCLICVRINKSNAMPAGIKLVMWKAELEACAKSNYLAECTTLIFSRRGDSLQHWRERNDSREDKKPFDVIPWLGSHGVRVLSPSRRWSAGHIGAGNFDYVRSQTCCIHRSTSSGSVGMSRESTRWPSAVTTTSSSMRTPIPRYFAGTVKSSL